MLYGAEYRGDGSPKLSGLDTLSLKDIPCAVCRRRGKSYVLMIPGKQTCYRGWNAEYTGFLVTAHKSHPHTTDYVCADIDAEPIDNDTSNKEGALFYGVRSTCGSLRCPPYRNHAQMLCVVCTT